MLGGVYDNCVQMFYCERSYHDKIFQRDPSFDLLYEMSSASVCTDADFGTKPAFCQCDLLQITSLKSKPSLYFRPEIFMFTGRQYNTLQDTLREATSFIWVMHNRNIKDPVAEYSKKT